jgi:drug/metabolite transporter (DMT)-like permease
LRAATQASQLSDTGTDLPGTTVADGVGRCERSPSLTSAGTKGPSVLAILLALISAAGYGSSDFAAGLASRRASVIRVTLTSEAVSVAVVGLVLALTGADLPRLHAVAWGGLAGLGGMAGAIALYVGFRNAAFSVAGPLSAVGAAGFSVLAGLLLGERPKGIALTGIVLALPAIVAVSVSAQPSPGRESQDGQEGQLGEQGEEGPSAPRRARLGVLYGLVAGACFALLFIGLNEAGSGSGLWPVFCGQSAALVTVACVAAVTGDLRLPEARGGWLAALTGMTGAPAAIFYFLATHHGLLAVTAVITSLYPAVTILLARVLLGERLTAFRLAGLLLAAASVSLIAVGGGG